MHVRGEAAQESARPAPYGRRGFRQHAQGGNGLERLTRLVRVERRLEGGHGELVYSEGTVERIPGEVPQQLGLADEDARLGSAEQLVSRERHEVHPRGDHSGTVGS